MAKPLMSIGIIFKNDIRCIERCLRALQPLRDAVPCELVMADTGSEDGSREIAEKYADILFDFPWINDFSAARNAVMDRSSGLWFFTVDTDEYLDEDVSELVTFLCASDERPEQAAMVIIRNHSTYEMDGDYNDFSGARVARMSTGVRYEGAIHEHLNFTGVVQTYPLTRTILHHDGYVMLRNGSEEGKKKIQRNLQMITAAMEKDPDNLLLRMQLLESGSKATVPDYDEQLRQTVQMVRDKRSGWEQAGPAVLRTALFEALQRDMPEWDEWLSLAEDWFPNSMFTRLDIEYAAFAHEWNAGKDYDHAIFRGERYLKALEDYRGGADPLAQFMSPLQMATPFSECEAQVNLINAYCTKERMEDAFGLIQKVDLTLLNRGQMAKLISALQDVHFRTSSDTAPIMLRLWQVISEKDQEKGKDEDSWKSILQKEASRTFLPKNRSAEAEKKDYVRHAYTLYLPLRDKYEIGIAAAVMEMRDPVEITAALSEVGDWEQFSVYALAYGLEQGAYFPVPDKPLNIEVMDGLATRLATHHGGFFPMALRAAKDAGSVDWQGFVWALELVLAAVRVWPWEKPDGNEEQGLKLARAFAGLEQEFLSRSYTPEALREDRLFALSPLHRFGWYCAQAFAALDDGDLLTGVQLLRAGLSASEGATKMVEFLQKRVGEMERASRIAAAPPELIELAKQVKLMLARFDPDDPAVAELKKSPAYQQVAWLIEKPASMVDAILQ